MMKHSIYVLLLLAVVLLPRPGHAQGNTSLRFYGAGRDGIDRVVIPLDAPPRPVDVGGDVTIEFWLKALPGENGAPPCTPGEDTWINGNIVIDRDIYFAGDYGDYGISLGDGRIAFGVHNGAAGATLCGITNVTGGNWHHVAVTRSSASGRLAIFVDGRLDAAGDGPAGDISYRDNRQTPYANDPYLVIGAEKHDAGPEYPSFSGWIDEVRISRVVRYTADFARPAAPFAADADTAALYHFDEGAGDAVRDSSGAAGGPSDGWLRVGGIPAGPAWSDDTPWSNGVTERPSPTALVAGEPAPVATPDTAPTDTTPDAAPASNTPAIPLAPTGETGVVAEASATAAPTAVMAGSTAPAMTPVPPPATSSAGIVPTIAAPPVTPSSPGNRSLWLPGIALGLLLLAGLGWALFRRR